MVEKKHYMAHKYRTLFNYKSWLSERLNNNELIGINLFKTKYHDNVWYKAKKNHDTISKSDEYHLNKRKEKIQRYRNRQHHERHDDILNKPPMPNTFEESKNKKKKYHSHNEL